MRIDLNSDLGESYGRYKIGRDEQVLRHITSANIACGFHAGDPLVMENTVKIALENGVSIGAHPGYPDLNGFGRRNMVMSPSELRACILYQVGVLKSMVEVYGGKLRHVKPHGSLYNMAARDYEMALVIARAVKDIDENLILVGLAGSMLVKAAKDMGIPSAGEAFADRAYDNDGFLVSRSVEGSVLRDEDVVVERVAKMIKKGKIKSFYGKEIDLIADTVCIHGDSDEALVFAKRLRSELDARGISIRSLGK
jgi:UPF0271 protein